MIEIAGIEISRIIIELQFQTKLNSLLLDALLSGKEIKTQAQVEELKKQAAEEVDKYYGGKANISYKPPEKG